MKSFAIYDHGVLHPSQFEIPEKFESYKQTQTFRGTTTVKAIGTVIADIKKLGYDTTIIEPALKALPKLEVKKGSFHFITVRWS